MSADPEQRHVVSRWDGGMRAVASAGEFEIVVDEPASAHGTNTGPQPTDLFLASVATCFTLALAHVARKRGLELPGLVVEAVGTYDGPSFSAVEVTARWSGPDDVLAPLLPAAERVCYVSNTLRRGTTVQVLARRG